VSRAQGRSWWFPLATAAGAAALCSLGYTWRIRRTNTAAYDRRLAAGERCIYVLWHARMLPLIYAYRGLGVAALVSQSRDGELIAGVIERIGYVAVRGSSTRGGQEGFNQLVRQAGQGRSLTITPDGPRGPREVVKPGLVRLASRTGLPVLPVASASRRPWVLRSWDGFRVPRPFETVWIAYGEIVHVPPDLDEAGVETWRRKLEASLRAHTEELACHAGEGV
jgi:lysophospholipid acyltransferase (LPLAT)-like uncharacterized protein